MTNRSSRDLDRTCALLIVAVLLAAAGCDESSAPAVADGGPADADDGDATDAAAGLDSAGSEDAVPTNSAHDAGCYLRTQLVVAPDGSRFAIAGTHGRVDLFGADGGRLTSLPLSLDQEIGGLTADRIVICPLFQQGPVCRVLAGAEARMVAEIEASQFLAFAPDGRSHVLRTGALVDTDTGTRRWSIAPTMLLKAAFSRDGRFLVTHAQQHADIAVMDSATGLVLARLPLTAGALDEGVSALAIADDGDWVALSGDDTGVAWQRRSSGAGWVETRVAGDEGEFLQFSPDGRELLYGGDGDMIRLALDGAHAPWILRGEAWAGHLADGRVLALGGDSIVRRYDAGNQMVTLQPAPGPCP